MKLSHNGYELIRGFEGVKNVAYQDSVGIWTVGIGFIKVNGNDVVKGQKMTDTEIEAEFFKQIKTYENAVLRNVTSPINQNQFDALVSFVYNLGEPNFKSSSLLKLINENPHNPSIAKEFLKWDRAGGKVIAGLTRRRQAEAVKYFEA